MKNVQRYDFVRSKLRKIEKYTDDNGFAVLEATPTRVGVLKYKTSDGREIRELRHPEDVFDASSMATLALKPFTLEHKGGFVTPNTAKTQVKGTTGENISKDGDHLKCNIAIYNKEALDSIENDLTVELSAGYKCDTIAESGIFEGEAYDYRQKNIRYNHVTATNSGRAGDSCRLRLDSNGAATLEKEEDQSNQNEDNMKMKFDGYSNEDFTLDACEVEKTDGTEKLMDMLKKVVGKMDGMYQDMDKMKKDMGSKTDSKDGKMDALSIRLDKKDEEISSLKKELESTVPAERLDSIVTDWSQIKDICDAKGVEPEAGSNLVERITNTKIKLLKEDGIKDQRLDSSDEFRDSAWFFYAKDTPALIGRLKSKRNLDSYKVPADYDKVPNYTKTKSVL